MQFPPTHYTFGGSAKKGKIFASGRKSRWLALRSPGSLLCPSCFQLSFKVELERPRRTWRIRRDMPRVCFQAQHWHSPWPSFSRTLLMQGRAEECLLPPGKDMFGLAARWTGQLSGNKSNKGRGELRHCSLLMSTDCLDNSEDGLYESGPVLSAWSSNKPRTSNLTSIRTLPNHAGWVWHANVQVLPAAAQRPVQTQRVRMRGLGTCLMEVKGKAI